MTQRKKELTRQLVVRVDDDLYAALVRDADEYGRTVAQTVRFILRRDWEPNQSAVASGDSE